MHELSLCRHLLTTLERQAEVRGYRRVCAIVLEVGVLAAVDPRALSFAWTVVSRGSLAEGARLEIRECLAQGHCEHCGMSEAIHTPLADCPRCDRPLRISGGETLRITELEVE